MGFRSRRFHLLALIVLGAWRASVGGPSDPPVVYDAGLRPSKAVAPFLADVPPGHDAFSAEKEAAEIAARLGEFGHALRSDPRRAAAAVAGLLAPGARGRLRAAAEDGIVDGPALEVFRSRTGASLPAGDAHALGEDVVALLADLQTVDVTEFLVTAIDADEGVAHTEVRYDIVGASPPAGRAERVGRWQMAWRRGTDRVWRVAEWSAPDARRSRAASPVFTETTGEALGANPSFRQQLGIPLDAWSASIDSTLTRDSNGHNGVSVGDADGDGLDDLYVAQPAGLPNRLFRNKGDGTFEDVTEKAGLAILDDTAQSLFADVDNDGDEDLILALSSGPALFLNDGAGHFTRAPDAFQFAEGLRGSPMSMAMADYDRDGFLDLYLCVYSFYYGVGEGKAGTPMPYYDARNGPPSVLFHNDGHGHFVEATREAGLEVGNDRYHFAAAWGDYDADGWPDLLVANDFGKKNLYHNLGRKGGRVRFEEVSAAAGVEDDGAGMSAAFVDYDNDGRLDIYTGNMWSDTGQRVTASPSFMPEAPAEVRAAYRHHARGNSLFHNLGNGRFEDVTAAAGVAMGRWAWSSDALDFDGDGWEDLYVVNGMLTRGDGPDLDGFFWRQVVARSPLGHAAGTPYDDAWRAINQLLVHGQVASHQRNVLLRNDGRGGFDEVAGTAGLDLDQDGRAFAVLDYDGDGDPDLAIMAARGAPQLRVFRNDFAGRGAALAVRLVGTRSNRDAIGARVSVETDRFRRTKTVQAGSGFLSQRSKELLFGLGRSAHVVRLTVEWPSGQVQTFADVALDQRLRIEEGGRPVAEPFRPSSHAGARAAAVSPALTPRASWLFEPFPIPDLTLSDLSGQSRPLSSLRGRPALVLLWSSHAPASRTALAALARGQADLAGAGLGLLAVALDRTEDVSSARAAAAGLALPVVVAGEEAGRGFAVLYRHLFMNRQPLSLPTALLLDAAGGIVKVYREGLDPGEIVADAARIDAPPAERLPRALPFAGIQVASTGARNYLPYAQELLDQGLEPAALAAFERAAVGDPSASTLYRLGTLLVETGQGARAREVFERALTLQPDFAEASNDLGVLLAQGGDLAGAIERFRAAVRAMPDYPDALNNLGYALLQAGHPEEARGFYLKAIALQPDFAEALNNLGLIFGREGALDRAEPYFRQALTRRPDYGEAAVNLALVLGARGRSDEAVRLLVDFLEKNPAIEGPYIALAKIHLAAGRSREALQVLDNLLQRNPNNAIAQELARRAREQ